MTQNTHRKTEYFEISGTVFEPQETQIAIEAEVTLTVNGEIWLGFHCSPDHLEDLAAGFLYNESFIDSIDEISTISVCEGFENIDVWLNHASQKPAHWNRTSGCGGGMSQTIAKKSPSQKNVEAFRMSEIQDQIKVFSAALIQMGELRSGIHSTVLMDGHEVISANNDIGRHNTLDKIAGDCLRENKKLFKPVLLTTGRISSDMVLKAERMGVGLVISLHSISSLAIETGAQLEVALIGHARSSKMGVYAHAELIIL